MTETPTAIFIERDGKAQAQAILPQGQREALYQLLDVFFTEEMRGLGITIGEFEIRIRPNSEPLGFVRANAEMQASR